MTVYVHAHFGTFKRATVCKGAGCLDCAMRLPRLPLRTTHEELDTCSSDAPAREDDRADDQSSGSY